MTHFKIDIQLPLCFNKEDGGAKIPEEFYFEAYEELLKLAGGINTTNTPILGSWINPSNKKRYDDKCVVYTILVESEDKMTITNVPKIKELIEYKKELMEKFKQHQIFMVATRCVWI